MKKIKCCCGHIKNFRRKASLFKILWSFFSSVKVAIWLIALILLLASLGTILPQEDFVNSFPLEAFYRQKYGIFGVVFYNLGFTHIYSSFLFFSLLVLIFLSLVICSLDRFLPLYKALYKKKIPKSKDAIACQRIFLTIPLPSEKSYVNFLSVLKKRFYKLNLENDALEAYKGKISHLGPYITHLGLIIFLFFLMLRYLPNFYLDKFIWLKENELKRIPNTDYLVQNRRTFQEFYPGKNIVKKYETDVRLYLEENGILKQKVEQAILVNHPLKYKNMYIFQASFRYLFSKLVLKLQAKKRNFIRFLKIDLNKPLVKKVYDFKEVSVEILEYYPDFYLRENKPSSRSSYPLNPAFVLSIKDKKLNSKELCWFFVNTKFNLGNSNNKFLLSLTNFSLTNQTGLMIKIDKRLPFLFVSGIIIFLGLILCFYFQYRRIWVLKDGNLLFLGAYTNKNWLGFEKELRKIFKLANLDCEL